MAHKHPGPRIEFLVTTQPGRDRMRYPKDARACQIAVYMIETGGTVRSAAQKFGISKSTVHKDDGVIIGPAKGVLGKD